MEPSALDDTPSEPAARHEVPVELLVFRVGVVWYAISALRVRSIVGTTNTVRIPGTPAFVAGVASVSGRIAVVVELGQLLGRAAPAGQVISERLVLIDSDGSIFAVLTDEVAG